MPPQVLLSLCMVVAISTTTSAQPLPGPNATTSEDIARRPLVPIQRKGLDNGLQNMARLSTDHSPLSLTGDAGQIWREYDISTFTRRLRDQTKPEQVIVDWILRETGTDAWFGETMSVLSATPEMIRVYHTPKVQTIVEGLMDRFLNSRSEQNEVAVRVVTINSPNWRTDALSIMTPVKTQTPGIEAWILSRENAALLLNELSRRPDYQEHNSPNLTIYNGQSHELKSTRPRLYTTAAATDSAWGGNVEQVDEGFSLQISPLVSADNRSIEAVVKCKVDQVEQMSPMRVSSVDPFGVVRYSQIQVPQLSSWQLHERFRWPVGDVLLVSRGVVATPGPTTKQGIGRMLGNKAPRADALLFLESRSGMDSFRTRRTVAERTSSANYRGRY